MRQLYKNGQRFYRMLPGKYPDKEYSYWVLWQRVVRRRLLWIGPYRWVDEGEEFWLDTYGFQPIVEQIEHRSGMDRRNHERRNHH